MKFPRAIVTNCIVEIRKLFRLNNDGISASASGLSFLRGAMFFNAKCFYIVQYLDSRSESPWGYITLYFKLLKLPVLVCFLLISLSLLTMHNRIALIANKTEGILTKITAKIKPLFLLVEFLVLVLQLFIEIVNVLVQKTLLFHLHLFFFRVILL